MSRVFRCTRNVADGLWKQRGAGVRVGMEATGYSRWFERLLAELGFELWVGNPAEIKAKRVDADTNHESVAGVGHERASAASMSRAR
jgi:transposase